MAEPRRTENTVETSEAAVVEALAALGDRLDALQEDVRRLRATPLPQSENGWDEPEPERASHDWLVALEPAPRRRPTAPRLLLEAAFLVAAAALAAAADLEPLAIAAVMAGAWVIVALTEWAAARAEQRRTGLVLAAPAAAPPAPSPDPAWFAPPVEHTLLESAAGPEPDTDVVRLPPRDDEDVVGEDTAERPPAPPA